MPQLIRLCYNWCYLGCFQSGTCCRLNVCVSLKFTFKQSPMWWHSGAGPLGGDCYEDAALVNGISALIKEPRDLLHASTTMWGHGKKVSSVNQKAAVPMCGICQHLRLGLPTSPSVRKKCLLFVSHSVYGSVTAARMDCTRLLHMTPPQTFLTTSLGAHVYTPPSSTFVAYTCYIQLLQQC